MSSDKYMDPNTLVSESGKFAMIALTAASALMWKDVIVSGIKSTFGDNFGWMLICTIILTVIVVWMLHKLPFNLPARYLDVPPVHQ